MGTRNLGNYEDLITFTRASGGTALRPVSYGSELVTNGGFATDSDWVKTQATISGGVCEINSPSGSYAGVYQAIPATAGKMYFISVEVVSVVTGSALVNVEGGSVGTLTTSGFITTAYVATDDTLTVEIKRGGGVTEFTIDNVSVKEVTFDDIYGDLTLFEHPVDVPRIEWDANGNRLGLLVEESRTNLFTYSEDFNSWGKVRATVNTNVIQAPDGTTTGDALVATAVNDDHAVEKSISATAQSYTFSAFIKAGDKSFVRLWQTNDDIRADFDLTNLTVGTTNGSPTATSIEDVGNGWRRCSITLTPTAGTRTFRIYALEADNDKTYLGDGSTEDIYIYGAQVEAGSFPTSYIKSNSGSTTTRSADVASIPVADFGYNAGAGTFLVEAQSTSGTTNAMIVSLESDANNRIEARYSSSPNTKTRCEVVSGGVSQARLEVTDSNEVRKISFAFTKDDFASSANGSAVLTDTAGTLPSATKIDIGEGTYSNSHINGHIKSIKYYPRRLSNAQLVELTS